MGCLPLYTEKKDDFICAGASLNESRPGGSLVQKSQSAETIQGGRGEIEKR